MRRSDTSCKPSPTMATLRLLCRTAQSQFAQTQLTARWTMAQWWLSCIHKVARRILAPLGVRVAFQPNSTLKQLPVWPKNRIPSEKYRCGVPDPLCQLPYHVCELDRAAYKGALFGNGLWWLCQLSPSRACMGIPPTRGLGSCESCMQLHSKIAQCW